METLVDKLKGSVEHLERNSSFKTIIPCSDCGSKWARDYNGKTLNVCHRCGQFVNKESV